MVILRQERDEHLCALGVTYASEGGAEGGFQGVHVCVWTLPPVCLSCAVIYVAGVVNPLARGPGAPSPSGTRISTAPGAASVPGGPSGAKPPAPLAPAVPRAQAAVAAAVPSVADRLRQPVPAGFSPEDRRR